MHSGFASPASGKFHADLKKEFTDRIEQLLAERAPAGANTLTQAPVSEKEALARKF